jgi:hypothetical protein
MASPLYRLLDEHFDAFRGRYEDRFERQYGRWRDVVDEVVARYLECGVLEAGAWPATAPATRSRSIAWSTMQRPAR